MIHDQFTAEYLRCQQQLILKFDLHCKRSRNLAFFSQNTVECKQVLRDDKELFKFKYEDPCKFNEAWQMASRGTTIIQDVTDSNNVEYYFSLNKFYNSHEIQKAYKVSYEEFLANVVSQGYNLLYLPKYDGSCLQCFTDKSKVKHRYTLGSLERNTIGRTEISYYEITEKLLQTDHPELYQFLEENVGYSLVCELITENNQIKTIYDFANCTNGILQPIAVIRPDGLPTFAPLEAMNKLGKTWHCNLLNHDIIKSTAFHEMETNPTIYGMNPEGLVLYACKDEICFPIAKLKRPEYFTFQTNRFDEKESLKRLQIHTIKHEVDDIPMTESQASHIAQFKNYLIDIGNEFTDHFLLLKNLENYTAKQYASEIECLPDYLKIYKNAFFKLRKDGFVFTTGYEAIRQLLLCTGKNGSPPMTIVFLQEEFGYDWFLNSDRKESK